MRLLSYAMCRLGMGASSLQKLVLVHVIEAAGKVTVSRVAEVGRELGAQMGIRLVYLGPHHSSTESDHTLEEDAVQRMIEEIELDDRTVSELIAVVDEPFGHFRAFADEMLTLARSGRRPEALR